MLISDQSIDNTIYELYAFLRCVDDYDVLDKIGEGTYGQVYKAKVKDEHGQGKL